MSDVRFEEQRQKIARAKEVFDNCEYPIIYNDIEKEEIRLPMEDGARLRTIVIKPMMTDMAFPTILMRTCYPIEEEYYCSIGMHYARRGFAYVIQLCRGTGGSEGDWEPNVNERIDGKTTIDWLCDQDWTGNTGFWGVSYMALTGWVIADILPPKVKTMYLTHYGVFRFTSAYKDGLFRHDVLTSWAMENAGFPIEADYMKSCLYRPHVKVDEELWGKPIEWYKKWVTNTSHSDPYWNEGIWKTLQEIPGKIKIPISMSEGWYDHHLGSAIETYQALSDECKAQSEFIIGPWDHWFDVRLDGRHGKNYDNDDLMRAFKWFYGVLVEEQKPKGRISNYVIESDYWTERNTYEIPEQKKTRFYLSNIEGKKALVKELGQVKEGRVKYSYDPENPILTHGGEALLNTREEIGSKKQPEADYREDVVSFVSAPLGEALRINGSILAHLHVSTDVPDTAFVVKVMNVMEDGTAYHVRGGITTLGYRNQAESRISYEPKTEVDIEITMWDIAWKFKKGTRIRIDIQSSDFPQYNIHTNTAGVWSEQIKSQIANQIILYGKKAPSYIEFPES